MLVLTRNEGETISIGDDIKITILEIKVSKEFQIKIGVEAPREIPVFRKEVLERPDFKLAPQGWLSRFYHKWFTNRRFLPARSTGVAVRSDRKEGCIGYLFRLPAQYIKLLRCFVQC